MKKPNITECEWSLGKNGRIYVWGKGPETKGYVPNIAKVSIWKDATEKGRANAKAISAVPDLIDALYGMCLSMKAHPGYQTGKNQEFIDYVSIAGEALKKAGVKL